MLTKHSTSASGSVSLLASSAYSAGSSRTSIALPPTPGLLDPLLNAAFAPPNAKTSPESPSFRSATSSLYSSPTPSLSALGLHAPCSPRPAHASLPLPLPAQPPPSLDFSALPKLHPVSRGPRGPRVSPPPPLRASIQQLRRMNSDASAARKERGGRGERRFLRLGREGSAQLPGEESWLDEREGCEDEELDEGEARRLVGGLLEWDGDGDAGVALGGAPGARGEGIATAVTRGVGEGGLGSGWDAGDDFWAGSPPPVTPAVPTMPAPKAYPVSHPAPKAEKRAFEVKGDGSGKASSRESRGGRKRRSALGDGSANANANANGNGMLTPGSYYDEEGFLRV